jgi:hypothetical protein
MSVVGHLGDPPDAGGSKSHVPLSEEPASKGELP